MGPGSGPWALVPGPEPGSWFRVLGLGPWPWSRAMGSLGSMFNYSGEYVQLTLGQRRNSEGGKASGQGEVGGKAGGNLGATP